MSPSFSRRLLAAVLMAAACFATACAGPGSSAGPEALPDGGMLPAAFPQFASAMAHPFKHIVVVIQENRTYDNLFATFPGGAGTTVGKLHTGKPYPLKMHPLAEPDAPQNPYACWKIAYDGGKMDGFDRNNETVHCGSAITPSWRYAYQYVDPSQIYAYWQLAKRYVLLDHLFMTSGSGSYLGHQDLIRGGTQVPDKSDPTEKQSLIDFPTSWPYGCNAPIGTATAVIRKTSTTGPGTLVPAGGPYPCFASKNYPTLADLFDARGLSWKYYAPVYMTAWYTPYWNAFASIKNVWGSSEWGTNVSMPETKFFGDVTNGTLPAMSWVTPSWQQSDHPGGGSGASRLGPQWVAQIVNAIGQSQYWNDTAIIVTWDDWGGFYDHVPPPQLDYQGLGPRVPGIIISAYSKQNLVAHTQYEFGSIIRFIEDNFGLTRLNTTDVRAKAFFEAFDFTQTPRPFVPITTSPTPFPTPTPSPTATPSSTPSASPTPMPTASPSPTP